jgi:predicted enzyme related to lactoylglutathione lyase
MEVADSARTRAFYGSVLGWRFAPGHVDDGWQVEDVAPMVGVSGGHDQTTTVPMYSVDNIDIAVERVRVAGGAATPPEVQPYATTSTCTDDQGTRFYLGQF